MPYHILSILIINIFWINSESNFNHFVFEAEKTNSTANLQADNFLNNTIEIYEKFTWCTGNEVNHYRIWLQDDDLIIDWKNEGILTDTAIIQIREEKKNRKGSRYSGIVYEMEINLRKVEDQKHSEYVKFKNCKSIRRGRHEYESISLWLKNKVNELSHVENDLKYESNQYIIKFGTSRIVRNFNNHEIGEYIQAYFIK